MPYPRPIQTLINLFCKLPGIGEKTAQRFVFFLLRQPSDTLVKMGRALIELHEATNVCVLCHNYTEMVPCSICANNDRDHGVICVVAYSHELMALERSGEFKGVYHVLGGNVNILDGVTPDKLRIRELMERIRDQKNIVKEVILAFNPDLEGESTGLYLTKLLKSYKVTTTRLARGLPRGADIEYADDVTLADAIKARREV